MNFDNFDDFGNLYDFDGFSNKCCNYFNENLTDVSVSVVSIVKNNNNVLRALQFKKTNVSIAPTIYLESYYKEYKEGINFTDICNKIEEVYNRSVKESVPDFEFIYDYGKARDSLFCRVVNTERNKNLLNSVPHVDCMDLSIVFYITVNMGDEKGSILIRNEHINNWKQELGNIYKDALNNNINILKSDIISIEEVLAEILRDRNDPETLLMLEMLDKERHIAPMYVLSNSERYFGAACILDNEFLDKFSDKINCDFYILPSSIHELIVVPVTDSIDDNALMSMVREVNATQVSCEDFLSDNIYRYDRSLGRVVPV